MKKSTKRTPVGEGRVRYAVTLTGEPVDPTRGDLDVAFKQVFMLQQLAEQPDLLICGTARFQKMVMQFSGNAWVVVMEAVVDEPTPQFVPGQAR